MWSGSAPGAARREYMEPQTPASLYAQVLLDGLIPYFITAGDQSHIRPLEAAARSWLGPGLEFVEGLGGLGEGVGDGSVPVHVGAAGA